MIALLPAYMKIDSSRWSGSCEDQPQSAGNGSFCSVHVEFLFVFLRSRRPLRVQPGVHCILPVRRSIICFLLRPTCRVHVDALWEARNMEARSQEKLMNVCNTIHDGFSGRGVAHSSHLRLSRSAPRNSVRSC